MVMHNHAETVSYTHLRAHETGSQFISYAVFCLKKKKKKKKKKKQIKQEQRKQRTNNKNK